jgi:hypothetical protein
MQQGIHVLQLSFILLTKEEVREDSYMQAGLPVRTGCQCRFHTAVDHRHMYI